MAKIKARWLVSLANGETAIEGKPPYEDIDGELSAWQKLRRYLSSQRTSITGIRIQLEAEGQPTRTYNLPSLSPKAKWSNRKPILPERFEYFRTVEQALTAEWLENEQQMGNIQRRPDADTHYIEIHAYYPTFKLVFIVDEDTGNESWAMILPLEN